VDSSPARGGDGRHGEALAQITTEIVRLYSEYYGRGPTRAKSYMLDEGFVVTVVRESMTTVECTLTEAGHGGQWSLTTDNCWSTPTLVSRCSCWTSLRPLALETRGPRSPGH
jgi:hypothetical protein